MADPRTTIARRVDWIVDGYVLGEYDLFECGARISRAVARHMETEVANRG
ncbi:hypothetical protein [Nocardia niigatensis]